MKPSSANDNRPVYTKSRTTKRKRPRLHGAFKGGFSAGHFNTVGSKNGWTPHEEEFSDGQDQEGDNGDYYSRPTWRPKGRQGARLSSKKETTKQKVEDYMDEEDANEWGGPSSVRKDYLDDFGKRENNDSKLNTSDSIGDLFGRKSKLPMTGSIGKQLLRELGWREDTSTEQISYVYVPIEEGENSDPNQNIFLASKRLRRIELKLSKLKRKLPTPKVDTYGLGYEPFQNAPEFKAYKELRKQRAEQRAIAATSSHGDKRINVYRTSALSSLYEEDPGEDDETEHFGRQRNDKNTQSRSGGDVLTYETTEDFVGSTTAGGFALHDDDDDVYDEQMINTVGKKYGKNSSKLDINTGDYHNEIYDASDSDVEGSRPNDSTAKTNVENVNIFAGALSAWAAGDPTSANSSTAGKTLVAMTSDGRPPLEGFTIGGDFAKVKMARFPGPVVPTNFVPTRHKFTQVNSIDRLRALSSNMKLQMTSKRRKLVSEKNPNPNQMESFRSTKPMAGGSFAALSTSLKSRFTTSSTNGQDESNGLKVAAPIDPTKINSHRTTFAWQPAVLLCKRLGITTPRVKKSGTELTPLKKKCSETREEKFFRQEILQKMDPVASKNMSRGHTSEEYNLSEENIDFDRPAMEYMKSIFEPKSDDDMSISEDEASSGNDGEIIIDAKNGNTLSMIGVNQNKIKSTPQFDTSAAKENPKEDSANVMRMSSPASDDSSEYYSRRKRDRRERRKHQKHKGRRKNEKRKKKKRSH